MTDQEQPQKQQPQKQPWDDEPDRVEWKHEGFPCLIVRNESGALCGYVAVPPGHPWHGRDAFGDNAIDASVHGGLTYSGACDGKICHVPDPGDPDDVWWLGFDCAHYRDIVPAVVAIGSKIYDGIEEPSWMRPTYKTVSFVKNEVEGLAVQAKAAA